MPPPVLMDDLVEEVLLRLPPDEPACLVRASAVCKPWRRILAGQRFRRRYREFHRTPPVLGLFERNGRFVPTSDLFPAKHDHSDWFVTDCRHGRALAIIIKSLAVFDPITGQRRRVPWPRPVDQLTHFSAAVLCAAQGCDHRSCQGGHFFVAFVTTRKEVSLGWLYSSETRVWSNLTPVHHPNVKSTSAIAVHSVLLGDAIYFNADSIIECQLGTRCLSMFEKPIDDSGSLMMAEDGRLGFAAVVEKHRVIDLKLLLPEGALSIPTFQDGVSGIAEGTQVIFVSTCVGSYMVDLKSLQVRMVSRPCKRIFPYMSFYIPAMEAACTGQGQ
ncbi:hypothetical protein VPH35_093321 [Triticum aestivum]|uniref:F-box domain-containing protein n=2 Tax=Triticum TaxID=4564 RepID=A0A9R0XKF1_TRITD|nr:uncharacterized protein LOC123117285 [Triticum aestivum]VAI38423.1 unnamed protein product [Triticum turgidum subsp. durum]